MKYLFIAEKPSLMRDVKNCYENHKNEIISKVGYIDFIALSGHVCANGEPKDYQEWDCPWSDVDYPMIPQAWVIKPINDKGKIATLKKIKEIQGGYDGIIVGTDSDVEGYGIYYLLEHFLKMENKKALRFMEHSLTDKEILESLLTMTDYHKDPVHIRFVNSFLLRSHADWLYGMNCTRLATLGLGELMTIGRVKAPTIKLVYDNSMAIENFKPRKYYHLTSNYGSFQGTAINKEGKPLEFASPNDINTINIPKTGIIQAVEKKETFTHAPQLYDLTALQGEVGQSLGMTPTKVLEIVQSLYEKHKVISYPRTQCRFISSEKANEFSDMLSKMSVFPELRDFAATITSQDIERVKKDKKVVNDSEVNKESHDALLPTSKTPVLSEMSADETKICMLIYKRLLAQFLPMLKEGKTRMLTSHGEYKFLSQGKVILDQGWRNLYGGLKDNKIPDLEKGATIEAEKITTQEKVTNPPKRLTQATLTIAMEKIANLIEDTELKKSLADSKGIGTSATRAAIILDIINRGYVEDRKGLYITSLGKAYVESLSGIDIISPVFAAQLDTQIKNIQRGEVDYQTVYQNMIKNLKQLCVQMEHLEENQSFTAGCPRCDGDLHKNGYNYICNKCGLQIPKQICGQAVSEDIIQELKNKQFSKRMKFKKKDGTVFEARLRVTAEGLKFDFSSSIRCPYCGCDISKGKYGYYCKCGLKIPTIISDVLSEKDIKTLVEEQYLSKRKGFKSKKGNTFEAALKIEDKKVEFIFD